MSGPCISRIAIGALTLAWICGCRYRDPSIELLEGELRWMEDQVYMLEDELERKCRELATCKQQGNSAWECLPQSNPLLLGPSETEMILETPEIISSDSLPAYEVVPSDSVPLPSKPKQPSRTETTYEILPPTSSNQPTAQRKQIRPRLEPTPASREPTRAEPQSPTLSRSPSGPALDRSATPPPNPDYEVLPEAARPTEPKRPSDTPQDSEPLPLNLGAAPELLAPPEAAESERDSLGPAVRPSIDRGAENDSTDSTRDQIQLSSHEEQVDSGTRGRRQGDADADPQMPLDAHVTHVVTRAWLAHDVDFDGREKAVDLLAIVEPRNGDGQLVKLSGPVSIVVLDANESGAKARVARWEFTAAQARRLFRTSPYGRGMHFQLEWPDQVPGDDQLHLFVRFVTVEGRKLEAESHIATKISEEDRIEVAGWQAPPHLRRGERGKPRGWSQVDRDDDPTPNSKEPMRLRPLRDRDADD